MESRKIKVAIKERINPKTGTVTLSLLGANFGPVVTGKDAEEAKLKMKKALRATFLANSLFNLSDLWEQDIMGKDTSKKAVDKSKLLLEEVDGL